jgi:hypothetical protein
MGSARLPDVLSHVLDRVGDPFANGLIAGAPVNLRRAPTLSRAIPMHINWALNPLADAGSVCLLSLLLVRWRFGDPARVFRRWHWGAFLLLLVWFLAQIILVGMFLYHDQLAEGKPLPSAALAPTDPRLSPTLFELQDRTIALQGHLPWLLRAPLFSGALVFYFQRQRPM